MTALFTNLEISILSVLPPPLFELRLLALPPDELLPNLLDGPPLDPPPKLLLPCEDRAGLEPEEEKLLF